MRLGYYTPLKKGFIHFCSLKVQILKNFAVGSAGKVLSIYLAALRMAQYGL